MVSEWRVIGTAQQVRLQVLKRVTYLAHVTAQPELIQRIKEAQSVDSTLATLRKDAEQRVNSKFRVSADELLIFQDKMRVSCDSELKKDIMTEVHSSNLSCIPKAVRCIKVCDPNFGGIRWKERWPTLFQVANMSTSQDRASTSTRYFSHYQFHSESENTSHWISWHDCLGYAWDMMSFE